MSAPAKVLVADDDPRIVRLVATALRREGCTVVVAHDGRDALDVARQETPDVLVLDVNMPWNRGRALQDKLARLDSPVATAPIVLLTGDTNECVQHDVAQPNQPNVKSVVYKPFELEQLLTAVKSAIADRS